MRWAAGFPIRLERKFMDKALSLGRDAAVVNEGITGWLVKDRQVREIYRVLEKSSSAVQA